MSSNLELPWAIESLALESHKFFSRLWDVCLLCSRTTTSLTSFDSRFRRNRTDQTESSSQRLPRSWSQSDITERIDGALQNEAWRSCGMCDVDVCAQLQSRPFFITYENVFWLDRSHS